MNPDLYLFELETISTIIGLEEFKTACLRCGIPQSWNAIILAFQVSKDLESLELLKWVNFQILNKPVNTAFQEACHKYIIDDVDKYYGVSLPGYEGHYFSGVKAYDCYLVGDIDGMESIMPNLLTQPINCNTPLSPITAYIVYQTLFLDLLGEYKKMRNFLQVSSLNLPAAQRQYLHTKVHQGFHKLHYGGAQ